MIFLPCKICQLPAIHSMLFVPKSMCKVVYSMGKSFQEGQSKMAKPDTRFCRKVLLNKLEMMPKTVEKKSVLPLANRMEKIRQFKAE